MTVNHVVVDGSNLATEGRTLPSLQQLDEAVRAYLDEFTPTTVTVVVDATLPEPHRRRRSATTFEEALLAGEVITPPAGVIGRGDAFLLQIADRADAVVLSNDSFQEFHGQYGWLFDQGRLIGGKPVPHVGWVFMERSPGARSAQPPVGERRQEGGQEGGCAGRGRGGRCEEGEPWHCEAGHRPAPRSPRHAADAGGAVGRGSGPGAPRRARARAGR